MTHTQRDRVGGHASRESESKRDHRSTERVSQIVTVGECVLYQACMRSVRQMRTPFFKVPAPVFADGGDIVSLNACRTHRGFSMLATAICTCGERCQLSFKSARCIRIIVRAGPKESDGLSVFGPGHKEVVHSRHVFSFSRVRQMMAFPANIGLGCVLVRALLAS